MGLDPTMYQIGKTKVHLLTLHTALLMLACLNHIQDINLVCFAFSGILEGTGATKGAGHAAQGCNAEDHLPSALGQSSPAEERVSKHETGSHCYPGKLKCSSFSGIMWSTFFHI